MMERKTFSSGTPWEKSDGYSRAVRAGSHIFMSGTTASNSDGTTVAPGNAYEQTVFIFRKIEAALAGVGAKRSDVVRTRMFVVSPDHLVEIEVDAVCEA